MMRRRKIGRPENCNERRRRKHLETSSFSHTVGRNLVQTLWPGGDKALEMLCGKAAVVSFYYVYMMYIIRPGIYVTFHHFPSFFFFLLNLTDTSDKSNSF